MRRVTIVMTIFLLSGCATPAADHGDARDPASLPRPKRVAHESHENGGRTEELYSYEVTRNALPEWGEYYAECKPEKKVVSGGCQAGGEHAALLGSWPNLAGTNQMWVCQFGGLKPGQRITAIAICE